MLGKHLAKKMYIFIVVLSVLSSTSRSEGFFGRNSHVDMVKTSQMRPMETFDILSRLYSRYDILNNAEREKPHQYEPQSVEDRRLKTFPFATKYKKERDFLEQEKLALLKNHVDELKQCKCSVQKLETMYENLKENYSKSLEKNKQFEEMSNNAQQELIKERLRSNEVTTEIGTVRKDLDACKAELSILQQEKENLQLKIKEEITREGILEEDKIALTEANDLTKRLQEVAIDEIQVPDQRVQGEVDLQKICQDQLHDEIKPDQVDYQELLIAANLTFQDKLEAKNCVITECAVSAINETLVEHQWEISMLKEYRNKEKKSMDHQLAELLKTVDWLEGALGVRNADVKKLTAKLRSLIEKHREEELQIISDFQTENV